MIFIVPDTNILFKSKLLQSDTWTSLDQHRDDWAIRFALPEIVLVEHVRNTRNDWRKTDSKVVGLHVGTFGAADEVEEIRRKIKERIDRFEEDFKARLRELEVEIVETPAVPHLEIAERAAHRTAPYQASDKDGYRDTVIWLTVLSIAETNAEAEIWFVSDNIADFASAPNWTGPNSGSPTDCPILFHPDLQEDMESRGLQGRVKYVKSLETLEQHLASLHGPISADELAVFVSKMDGSELSFLLEEKIKGQRITPSQAALSLNTVSASIVNADSVGYQWRFSDSARRGQGRWTANFDITVDAYVLTRTHSGDAVMVSKLLDAGGRITFNESSEVESLQILSVEALSDDPNRSLWTAEAQLERVQGTRLSLDFFQQLLPKIDTSFLFPGINWDELIGSRMNATAILSSIDFSSIAPPIDTSQIFGNVDLSNLASVQGVSNLIRAAGAIAQAEDVSLDDDLEVEELTNFPPESEAASDAAAEDDSHPDSQEVE